MLYVYGAIAAALIGLGATAYIYYLKYENVSQRYEQVLEVNKANTVAMKKLREAQAFERALTAKELEETQKRASSIEVIKQEIGNAPDAQEPAGPTFDELSRRLRALGSGTAD